MQKQDLGGIWTLLDIEGGEEMEGTLPGCNYLDLMKNRKIRDPFWGVNEKSAIDEAEKDFEYIIWISGNADNYSYCQVYCRTI